MAVGPSDLPALKPVAGVRIGVASAGIKRPGRRDVVVFELAEGSSVAASLTRNQFCAAPVQLVRRHLAASSARYLVINTGNANAGTGEQGLRDAAQVCQHLAELAGCDVQAVLPFSTGVIGEPLPVAKIEAALPAALADLAADNWAQAAAGIMTTDTRPKGSSRTVDLDGVAITVTGISKGAGMIRPNMATMLAYVATDAAVSPALLQPLLQRGVAYSFNRITVDGDTSTNDACMLVATGASGAPLIDDPQDPRLAQLTTAIDAVLLELAQAVVRDGEGATKFVSVAVAGGRDEDECLKVGFTIAESPLVKTALFASDPNWGRLLAAIGRAGLDALDVALVDVHINGVLIAERGGRAASYREEQGAAAMRPEEITIAVNLRRGDAAATVWTTDLSYDYVKINAEYRS
ncbi:MAG TPA: bifunctional glutamate N-acetyltransferase/amino-acid acetyltransferase ArgJ [Spongiibacteraceae bacterium]|nr:bifunctional glutamate N-acetyltransferase/amino-acid acetyltransferase ArgJ [Spongiibacteraceae bacterium]